MSLTYTQATDEMFGLLNTSWQNAASICGYVPEMRWKGNEENGSPDFSKFSARASRQTVIESQSAFVVKNTSERRLFTSNGLIFVQLFCPKTVPLSMEIGGKLATLARDAFRGTTTASGIWFRNARINENLPPEESCYRINVVAEFQYDEIS